MLEKYNDVYTQICTCEHPADLFAMEMKYHKHCSHDYFRLQRNSTTSADRPSNKIPHELLMGHFLLNIQPANIIIISSDTDVFILGKYFWRILTRLWGLGLWFDGSYKKKFISGCHLAALIPWHIFPALHSLSALN